MIDPERLLDTDLQDTASLRERELLGSLRPSASTQTAVWRRIVGQGVLVAGATAATAAATTTAASASASAATGAASATTGAASAVAAASTATVTTGVMSSLAAKAGVALIVAVPVVGGTVYLTQGTAERTQPVATTARIEAARQAPEVHTPQVSNAVTESSEKKTELAVVPAPEPTRPEANAAPLPANADALREENRLLRDARAFERAGNPGQALRILNELDRLFAHGALLQEREILRIQSLSATGSGAAAKARAEQFLKRYPASPYVAHVRSILDGSSP